MESYYIVHTIGRDADHFMVLSETPMTEQEVIARCDKYDLFMERKDAKNAYVDMNPSYSDMARFKNAIKID